MISIAFVSVEFHSMWQPDPHHSVQKADNAIFGADISFMCIPFARVDLFGLLIFLLHTGPFSLSLHIKHLILYRGSICHVSVDKSSHTRDLLLLQASTSHSA